MYRDESQVPDWERERAEYTTHQNTLANQGYVEMFRKFLKKAVEPFVELPIKSGRKLTALDYGSGPGDCVLSHVMREEAGFDVDIYDVYFSPGKVFEGRQYNIITCTEVLEHLTRPMDVLALFKRHLKPGGIMALMTLFHPVGVDDLQGEALFQDWWYRRDITHICYYRPRTFHEIGGRLGLKLLTIDERNTLSYILPEK